MRLFTLILCVAVFGCVDPTEIETLKKNQAELLRAVSRINKKLDVLGAPAPSKACPDKPIPLNEMNPKMVIEALKEPCSGVTCSLVDAGVGVSVILYQAELQRTLSIPSGRLREFEGLCK